MHYLPIITACPPYTEAQNMTKRGETVNKHFIVELKAIAADLLEMVMALGIAAALILPLVMMG